MKSKLELLVVVVILLLVPSAAYPQQGQTNPKPDSQKVSSEEIQPPQIVHTTPVVYPPETRDAQKKGTVVIEVLVDKEGKVAKATVLSGDPVFAAPALEAVKEWKFKPATLQGQPVEKTTQIRFNYPAKSVGSGR